MNARFRNVDIKIAEANSSDSMAEAYISMGKALKLVILFTGSRMEVLTFISNVNTAFDMMNLIHGERLYKFMLTNGENRTAIAHRNLDNWVELREISRNTQKIHSKLSCKSVIQSQTRKSDSVSEWIKKVQTLVSKFRESALTEGMQEE
jgi:hypothetical protein